MSRHYINVDTLDRLFVGGTVEGWSLAEAVIVAVIEDCTGERFTVHSTTIGSNPGDDGETWEIAYVEDSGEEMVEVFPA